jgi:hypothetical protein
MAERSGVSPQVLRAVLKGDVDNMPADVVLVWRFTRATLTHEPADEYRDAIVKRWGPRALVSLAFAIIAARTHPTRKSRWVTAGPVLGLLWALRRSPSTGRQTTSSSTSRRQLPEL